MEENILLSVIMPVYNVKQYLEKSIQSVLTQTHHNLEVILVDDGSTDGSSQMCDYFASTDNRIKVVHQTNSGVSIARNTALNMANGDYICFADSDDYQSPEIFEKLLSSAIENNCDISICGHYTEREGNISIEEPVTDEVIIYNSVEAIEALIEDKLLNNYLWDKIFKKELFDNLRFPIGREYEDVSLMYLLFDRANRICRIPECLYYYQKRSGSISYHVKNEKKWFHNCSDFITAKTERFLFFKENGNTLLEQKSLASLITTIYEGIRLAHLFSQKEKYNQYLSFLKKYKKEIKDNPYTKKKEKQLLLIYKNHVLYPIYALFKQIGKSISK